MFMCNAFNNHNTTDLEIGKTCYQGLTYFCYHLLIIMANDVNDDNVEDREICGSLQDCDFGFKYHLSRLLHESP